jgi:DNA-binding transcriptional regulator YiaG
MSGREFKRLRNSVGLSQGKVSKEIGVTVRTLTRWETGETRIPKMAELALRYVIEQKQKGSR